MLLLSWTYSVLFFESFVPAKTGKLTRAYALCKHSVHTMVHVNKVVIFVSSISFPSPLYQGITLSLTNVITYLHCFLTAYKRLWRLTVLAGTSTKKKLLTTIGKINGTYLGAPYSGSNQDWFYIFNYIFFKFISVVQKVCILIQNVAFSVQRMIFRFVLNDIQTS